LNGQQINLSGNNFIGYYDVSKDNFHLKAINENPNNFTIDIINISGQVLFSSAWLPHTGGEWMWNLSHLPHGVYFAKISTGAERQTFKFMK